MNKEKVKKMYHENIKKIYINEKCSENLLFVCDEINNSLADYDLIWRVLCVCLCECLGLTLLLNALSWRTEIFCDDLVILSTLRAGFQPPQPPNPLCNQAQYANITNFGPIWMKLCMEVKNG